ncbi:Cyclopropane-fatty-acyl-phospholipid synthase [Gossypium australe]|uniref:Cyclopropane-fatty-acyl-phospholipid synthase n=1 Tax=Gossypium australe TaxID=47621 RepID=A0A5B6V1X0_9ROSI|nr:Cyclopropane-fatty-acyl-phospholipid synthase [Gossypium australe]
MNKITGCVQSVRYLVKCNNILSDIIIPERGFRQEDPLSPYLFLFYMEAFSSVIEDIQAKLSKTWWSGKEKGKFWSMHPWKTLCHPKGMSGLGIRDIRLFNLALIWRQVWRLINSKDTLYFKVLSSKYFPDGNIFHAKRVDKLSLLGLALRWREKLLNTVSIGKLGVVTGLTFGLTTEGWKKLDTLPKVRVFTWRVGHEILPTNVKLASIRRGFDQGCPKCKNASNISKKYACCIDWLEDMMKILDKRAMVDLMKTLWNCWNNINNYIFRGKKEEAQIIWERASTLSKEFRICNLLNEPLFSQNIAVKKWEKPLKGFVKINFDATVGVKELGMGRSLGVMKALY